MKGAVYRMLTLEQGEQQRRVHHLGTGKGEAEYGKLIPQGTSYQ